tara:strand:- start:563 stop:1585 length:1023 start_codon:yes stop_codon:yes gene_type:complete
MSNDISAELPGVFPAGISKGVVLCIVIGIFSYIVDSLLVENGWFSLGSGTTAFILGGIVAQRISNFKKGGEWVIEKILPVSIVLLGFGLNLSVFLEAGDELIGILIGLASALTCLISCYLIGRIIGLERGTSLAIGSGGAICGNSAVVAVSSPLKISQESLAMTLATVNLLGILTFLSIPLFSSLIELNEVSAGIWAGSTIHAVPQAISAGEAIGGEGMILATTVKLSRVSLLILVIPLCAMLGEESGKGFTPREAIDSIPNFLPGFVLAAFLSTWIIGEMYSDFLSDIGKLLLSPILAAIGLFITKESIENQGVKIFTLGAISSALMILVSYILISILI